MGIGMGTGMGWMWLFWLVLLAGVVTVVLVVTRAVTGGVGRGGGDRAPSRARAELDDRYARGELTTEEYQERRRALGEPT